MARTTRIPNTYADEGAVAQQGSLPVYRCNTCGNEVVWAVSKRTGKRYLVNVARGYQHRFYRADSLHDCAAIVANRERAIAKMVAADELRIRVAAFMERRKIVTAPYLNRTLTDAEEEQFAAALTALEAEFPDLFDHTVAS